MGNVDFSEALKEIVAYRLSDKSLPNGYVLARREMALFLLGLGGLNYVYAAYSNGSTYSIQIINAVTTAVLGEVLLYTSGEIYWKMKLAPQDIPSELEPYIEAPLSDKAFARQIVGQSFLAAASSVPLATTILSANLGLFKQYPWLKWTAFALIELVNTAMHLVPVEIIMNHPDYGFMFRWLSSFSSWLNNVTLTSAEVERSSLLARRAEVLNTIHPVLMNAKQHFLSSLLTKSESEVQEIIQQYKRSSSDLLKDMLVMYKPSKSLSPMQEKIARSQGFSLMTLACLGYAANAYLVFKYYFHFSTLEALGVTIVPIFFFMVLMGFFGDGMGKRLFQDTLSLREILFGRATWGEKMPIEAKFYPKMFVLSITMILFSMVFTGAPGREMMKDAYQAVFPTWLMVIMYACVDVGIGGLLTWYALFDITKKVLQYSAQYAGQGVVQNVAEISAKIDGIIADCYRIKPEYAEGLEQDIRQCIPADDKLDTIEIGRKDEGSFFFFCCRSSSATEDSAIQPLLK